MAMEPIERALLSLDGLSTGAALAWKARMGKSPMPEE